MGSSGHEVGASGPNQAEVSAAGPEAGVADSGEPARLAPMPPWRIVPELADFSARLEMHRLGPVLVADFFGQGCRFETQPATAASPPALVYSVLLDGSAAMTRRGHTALLGPGGAALALSSDPFVCAGDTMHAFRSVVVTEPLLAGLSLEDAERACHSLVVDASPESTLLSIYARTLSIATGDEASDLSDLLGEHLLDLVVAAVAKASGRDDPTAGRGARALRLEAARRIVSRRCGERNLGPEVVADCLGISVGHLGRMLSATGTSFADMLAAARRERAEQLLAGVPAPSLEDVAAASGFASVADLRRSLKARVVAPRERW